MKTKIPSRTRLTIQVTTPEFLALNIIPEFWAAKCGVQSDGQKCKKVMNQSHLVRQLERRLFLRERLLYLRDGCLVAEEYQVDRLGVGAEDEGSDKDVKVQLQLVTDVILPGQTLQLDHYVYEPVVPKFDLKWCGKAFDTYC